MMSNFPDFSANGYEAISQLGHNATGGRVVYLAKRLSISESIYSESEQLVAVKQFQFIKGADWAGFKAIEREIEVLQNLSHPGIPRYLDSFETNDGYCIVQEYKNAKTLSDSRSFDAEQVKQIAIAILEILVYLQNRIPPIIHRDLKPENILVDELGNVYLIDFGFARIGAGEIAMSSVAAGTFGFMAPEQLRNRELNAATDLYGLGATIICLLTNTRSTAIDAIVDDDGRINFQHLLPSLGQRFIAWLEKMVAPKRTDRYANADEALQALRPLSVTRSLEVQVNCDRMEFKAKHLNEQIVQSVTVTGSMPQTTNSSLELILEGRWEVAPHPSDPPHMPDAHAWIAFMPKIFNGNTVDCAIAVNTSLLMADSVYDRMLLLHTNSEPETISLPISVQTASPLATQNPPYFRLAALLSISPIIAVAGSYLLSLAIRYASFMLLVSSIIYFGGSCLLVAFTAIATGKNSPIAKTLGGTSIGIILVCLAFAVVILTGGSSDIMPILVTFVAPLFYALFGAAIGSTFKASHRKGFDKKSSLLLVILTTGLGLGLGLALYAAVGTILAGNFSVRFIFKIAISLGLPTVIITGLPLFILLLRQHRLAARHKATQQHLIKP
jgi:serine/threonine protein kinase